MPAGLTVGGFLLLVARGEGAADRKQTEGGTEAREANHTQVYITPLAGIDALNRAGITIDTNGSGLNLWIPVDDERNAVAYEKMMAEMDHVQTSRPLKAEWIQCMSFLPRSQLLVAGSSDRIIAFYDLSTKGFPVKGRLIGRTPKEQAQALRRGQAGGVCARARACVR